MGTFDPSAALGAAFTAFGVDATYTPPGVGAAVACVAVPRREDQSAQFGGGRALASRGLFEIREAELANPERGGTLTIASAVWKIEAVPEKLDPDRLVWTLRCAPVSP